MWWFASVSPEATEPGLGRFDLPEPLGTCYLSGTTRGAALDLVGHVVSNGWVAADLIAGRVVSAVRLPTGARIADASSPLARPFLEDVDLATTSDYATTQRWARALHDTGYQGICSVLPGSTGEERELALFGESGTRNWSETPALSPLHSPWPTSESKSSPHRTSAR